MTITQHVPAFMEGFESESGEFETREELERVPFVARWASPSKAATYRSISWDADGKTVESTHTMAPGPAFKRFSWTGESYDRRDTLMAEMENGAFWVVGFMDKGAGEKIGLPRWVDSGARPV